MYIKREIEATIDAMLKQGKVVLVAGARQVGKTTVLKHHLGGGFDYVSMDDPRERALALEDAALFFESRAFPHYRRSAARPRTLPRREAGR